MLLPTTHSGHGRWFGRFAFLPVPFLLGNAESLVVKIASYVKSILAAWNGVWLASFSTTRGVVCWLTDMWLRKQKSADDQPVAVSGPVSDPPDDGMYMDYQSHPSQSDHTPHTGAASLPKTISAHQTIAVATTNVLFCVFQILLKNIA